MPSVVSEAGIDVVEGAPGECIIATAAAIDVALEACFASHCRALLLYEENLPADFSNLRSGIAGAILQKLRNYGVRLAVVRTGHSPAPSGRFGELVAEEHTRRNFALFETRAAARAWLAADVQG